jgi:hypothetical protein
MAAPKPWLRYAGAVSTPMFAGPPPMWLVACDIDAIADDCTPTARLSTRMERVPDRSSTRARRRRAV